MILEKFNKRVEKTGGCWNWTGNIDVYGYGAFYVMEEKKIKKAHRVAYELFVGPIPKGLVIDHLCRNTRCVYFRHLNPTTIEDNARHNYQLLKTECPKGHTYNSENTHIDRQGARRCKACAHQRYLDMRSRTRGVAA